MNGRHVALGIGIIAISCSTAFAHPGHIVPSDALLAGWGHPWLGLDHLLAMVAVGLLSVQLGGRALLILPASFLGMMVFGAVTGMHANLVPSVESGIAVSVAALGFAVALGRRYPVTITAVAIGVCGLLHGHVHGTEMSGLVSPTLYVIGLATATIALHVLGICGGLAMAYRESWTKALRLTGIAISTVGMLLLLGVI